MAMDTYDLSTAEVLAALYNAAQPQGMGFLQYDPTPMTVEQAQTILDRGHMYFDYLQGRVMKIDVTNPDPYLFDRDNGEGAADLVLSSVALSDGDVNNQVIQLMHVNHRAQAASEAKKMFGIE